MTYLKASLVVLGIFAFSSPVMAQLTKEESANLDRILAGIRADPDALKKARVALGLDSRPPARPRAAVTLAPAPKVDEVVLPPRPITLLNKHTPAVREQLSSTPSGATTAPQELSPCAGLNVLLRQDWKDIGLLGCPETTDKASGAELSYSSDRIAHNNLWTARGTAAVYYNSLLDAPGAYYKSFGAYVTLNRAINSAPAFVKGDSDKVAYGGVGEIGIQTETGAQFFRLRGGGVEDYLKDTTSANITGEWVPVYSDGTIRIHRPFPVFDNALILRFDPVFLVQYNAVTGKKQLLDFNGRTHALRVGPQLTLRVFPGLNTNDFFSRLSATATYHWAYETYTSKEISWFQSSITYNLDDAGQFGITGSYKKGRDEDTGTLTDIYKIALTGKI